MSSRASGGRSGSVASQQGRRIVLVAGASTLARPERDLFAEALDLRLAPSGQEVVSQLEALHPSLLVLGEPFESLSPADLCRVVRADPGLRQVSILYVGGPGDIPMARLTRERGANAALLRPFTDTELLRTVGTLSSVAMRLAVRVLLRLEVRLEHGFDEVVGLTRNISSTGMLVDVDRALEVDEAVTVRFFLSTYPREIVCQSKVVRVAETKNGHRALGLHFMLIADSDRRAIETYVLEAQPRER
jgi:PleD family two-component response regulator